VVTRPEDVRLVCQLLNQAGARYLLVGGQAVLLHGVVRATKDIDIFIPKDLENLERILDALGELPYRIAREIDPVDALRKPITIIGDDPRVDLLTFGQGLPFDEALARCCEVEVEGVRIPYMGLDDLIRMKDTSRLQDQSDVQSLRRLKALRAGGSPSPGRADPA
jgi:predicted nucleotidyltransferase